MKATFSARAYDQSYGPRAEKGRLRWPQVYRLSVSRNGIDRQSIEGMRDYSARIVSVWYVVDDGIYEIVESPPKGEESRTVKVSGGSVVGIDAEDAAKWLASEG